MVSSKDTFSIVQIGCGVVGDAYAQAFQSAGHRVIGIEVSSDRIAQLCHNYEMHHVSEDLSLLSNIDFILLSINTPLDPKIGALNMSYIWNSICNVSQILSSNPDALVVVRSTVTTGFCDSYKAALAGKTGHDVRLCFQPEFLRAKSALQDAMNPWQVVIGCYKEEEVQDYRKFQTSFIVSEKIVLCTVDEAEIMKIFHNSFNAMKISFFNQAYLLVEALKKAHGKDINAAQTFSIISKTCEGLLNPKYGLTPGHAYYGTCLPKDSAELAHMEKKQGLKSKLFQSIVDVNDVMKTIDTEEVLHGDNHIDNHFLRIGSPLGIDDFTEQLSKEDIRSQGSNGSPQTNEPDDVSNVKPMFLPETMVNL